MKFVQNQLKQNTYLSDEEEISFVQLEQSDFSYDIFKSQILKGQQPFEFIKLCEFNTREQFKLLYRASQDGFRAEDFHSKCDGYPNYLTIFKANRSLFVFGGFTTVAWESLNQSQYKSDTNAKQGQ